jgi:PBP1b-binding outer membrane lipoprotein LpoB
MKRIHTISKLLLLAFLLVSCSTKMNFAPSSVVPAATGHVKIKKDNNKNYIVTVSVLNLADPKNLNPSRKVYVVWLEDENNSTKNIGQITSSSSMFSKALKGEVQATATSKPGRIFITAEDDGNVQSPGSQMVLTTR